MSEGQDPQAELLRRFEAVIADAGLDELRELTSGLLALGGAAREVERPRMPDLRRAALDELRLFRVRVDLKRSRPPIWRRLEVRSDLRLDALHQVLQAAFSWDDYHLWRFSLGGGPFNHGNQLFLCPYDVHEGEFEDEGGIPAGEVRLDETMQEPRDVLSYVYDYGDHWELALRLEEILPADTGAPSAVCVDGRRAAPPEDCGSLRDAEDLAEVLEDPARFDMDEINQALRAPFFALREAGLDPELVDLVNRLAYSPVGEDLTARAIRLIGEPAKIGEEEELRDSLRAFTWFLERAVGNGIQLTAAGYLKPADVEAAAKVVPMMDGWIGKVNREIDTAPCPALSGAAPTSRAAAQIQGHAQTHQARRHGQDVKRRALEHPRRQAHHRRRRFRRAGGAADARLCRHVCRRRDPAGERCGSPGAPGVADWERRPDRRPRPPLAACARDPRERQAHAIDVARPTTDQSCSSRARPHRAEANQATR